MKQNIQDSNIGKIKMLKDEFKKHDILTFPGDQVKAKIPQNLKGEEVINWYESAKNYWNNRNNKEKIYLSVFEEILEEIISCDDLI